MYNTVLGAKPLSADGSDVLLLRLQLQGAQRRMRNTAGPCCSGTLPQVAADYRINTYFRDGRGIFVNLYIPSSVRWTQGGAQVRLTQAGTYPFDALVRFEVEASRPAEFALRLRIPAWADAATVSVNGKRQPLELAPGRFASLLRTWRTGDRIELELPMGMRLEAVDPQHPDTVALIYGPIVLFAVTNMPKGVTRKQLLAAKRTGPQSWQIETANGPVAMLPFIAIGDQQYSTYLRV